VPPIDTVLVIDTPEHLAFQVRVAGPARRLFAWLLDLLVRLLIGLAIGTIVALVFSSVSLSGVAAGIGLIVLFALNWGYFVVCELMTGGRSPGKIWLKLRVVRSNGLPITWRESAIRNLLGALDLVVVPPHYVLPLGALVIAFDPRFRRPGDMAAGTIVVVEEATQVASKSAVAADEALVSELPGVLPLDRDDLQAIELFVHRQHMSDARREELAEIVAGEYALRLGRPRPRNASAFLASIWARAQAGSQAPISTKRSEA
jgi:uncharacterized RDD family membrane protein YckC